MSAADLDAALAAIFAPDGPLSRALPDYRPRAQQREMASRVGRAIRERRVLLAEAGTGTGKTVAYLVPALLAGGKVIISTGTKTLQDQLFHRDLPAVRAALGLSVTAALLKGRANYVCPYHLARNLNEARLPSRQAAADLHAIARFARRTRSGDKAELATVPEDSPAWLAATSTRDNCLGGKCPDYAGCFVMRARRDALGADVVVVNHHLFFADVMLKDEGMAELLPACNTIVLDEAHQLPETASDFFGETISTRQILELCRDATAEASVAAPDLRELQDLVRHADKAVRDLRLAVGLKEARVPAAALDDDRRFADAVATVRSALGTLARGFNAVAERSEGLANCARRAAELADRLDRWSADDGGELVRWVEAFTQALALHMTPLSIATPFRRQLDGAPRAWIFTSATLAVRGDFSHYQHELGLDDADTASWESPFDYAANALLYLPPALPLPNNAAHTDAVVDAAVPVLAASGGRAFVLFTSLRAMRQAHARLADRMRAERLELPLLLQGEGSRTELLERFRRLGNAVLVASASFWEGVDVRGAALSVVVIDKLPFAPPGDPVLAARLEHLRRGGRNPFLEYQVPQAAIALKQGTGRLIRDERDRGVLVLCDPRVLSKPYGSVLLESLPPMRRTRAIADVAAFFAPSLG
ncbi:MAG TPA: ATP-dependent DNA helicase [Burkholderiales bacterium]|nr:ATP-dependent DNA helicase [Burkholderiales bacterium]